MAAPERDGGGQDVPVLGVIAHLGDQRLVAGDLGIGERLVHLVEPAPAEVGGRLARVAVRDQGLGITPEDQATIWERFQRAPSALDTEGGLGLGLYIARTMVERHGGLVWSVCRRVLPNTQDAEDAFQATFLVLARKSSSIRKGEAVASWLYGVACRIAMKELKRAARARQRMKPRSEPIDRGPAYEAAWRDLQRVLDEELSRLPEKYRSPLVLCCLEGLSKSEAARRLGWL